VATNRRSSVSSTPSLVGRTPNGSENNASLASMEYLKTVSIRAPVLACSSHLDDDLAPCASLFNVGQSRFRFFEGKDPIHDRPDDPSIDERTDLV